MAFRQTSTDELAEQVNKYLAKKYENPAVILCDWIIGLVVKHGSWRYRCDTYTEAFTVADRWSRHDGRKQPKWIKQLTLLEAATEFVRQINVLKRHKSLRPDELQAALQWIQSNTSMTHEKATYEWSNERRDN